jgi:hypothetical protein
MVPLNMPTIFSRVRFKLPVPVPSEPKASAFWEISGTLYTIEIGLENEKDEL